MFPSPNLQYATVDLRDLKFQEEIPGYRSTQPISFNGLKIQSSNRFTNSLWDLLKVHPSTTSLFSPTEIVDRVVLDHNPKPIQICYEETQKGELQAIGCCEGNRKILRISDIQEALYPHRHNLINADYSDGLLRTRHRFDRHDDFKVMGDDFKLQYSIDFHLDGRVLPTAETAIERLVCMNIATANIKKYQAVIPLGLNTDRSVCIANLSRFLGEYTASQHSGPIKDQLTIAHSTPASLHEAFSLKAIFSQDEMKTVHRRIPSQQRSDVETAFHRLAGELEDIEGVSNIKHVPHKRRTLIPCRSSVYELFNLCSEVSTYRSNSAQKEQLSRWMAKILIGGYDLQGLATIRRDSPAKYLNN